MINDIHYYLKSQSIPFCVDHHSSYRKKNSKKLRKVLYSPTDSCLLKMRQIDSHAKNIPKKLKMKILLPFTSYLGFVKAHYKGSDEFTPSRVTFVTMRRTVNPRKNKPKGIEFLRDNLRFAKNNEPTSEDSIGSGRQLCKKAKMIRIGGIGDKSGISLANNANQSPKYMPRPVTMMKPIKPCLLKKPSKKPYEAKKRVSFETPMISKIVNFINTINS